MRLLINKFTHFASLWQRTSRRDYSSSWYFWQPLVFPNTYWFSISNSPTRPQINHMPCLNNTFPSLRTLVKAITVHDRTIWKKFCFKYLIQQSILTSCQSPNLLRQERVIKLTELSKAHSSFILWETQFIPTHPANFPLLSPIPPPKFLNQWFNFVYKPFGSLKHDMVYVGIAWITALMRISLPACDSNFSFQPFNFFQILSLIKLKDFCFPDQLETVSPNIVHIFGQSGPLGSLRWLPESYVECWCWRRCLFCPYLYSG